MCSYPIKNTRIVTKLAKSFVIHTACSFATWKYASLPKTNDVTLSCSKLLLTMCYSYCYKGQKNVLAVDKQGPEVFLYGLFEEWRP